MASKIFRQYYVDGDSEKQIKRIVKWLLFLCLSPVAIFVAVLSLGGVGAMFIYNWTTDNDGFFENFFVAIAGEIAWLGVLILMCGIAT